ncbi:hypothetical protein HQ560_05660, partial [bacterium]|nr:hypothetical protein [bacterium]
SQARARLRRVFRAVGVLLVLALLGAGGYFGVTEGIPRLRAHLASATPEPVDDDEPDPEPEPDEPAPPTPPPPAPAEPRRDVLRDYLVAITGDAWTARPVRERLYMAAEAGSVATAGKATAKTAQRLAGALDAERAVAIDNNTLHESVLRGLDGVRKAVEVDLRRHKALGQRLEGLRRWHGKASASGAPLLKRLVLSSAVFYQLTVTAEAGLEPKMGLEARLLLLDGALSPIAKSDDLGRIADRVCRGGSLFVRYLRRSRKGGVLDELVDDAARRIAAARRTADSLPRLALAMEGVVEALVACKGN